MTSSLIPYDAGPGNDDEDAYFSVDVETDGPIPGVFSMLAFAIVEAGYHDGRKVVTVESPKYLYSELPPIYDNFEPEALAVNGLDREELRDSGKDPATAMKEAADWINSLSRGRSPVMVASPAGFDWMFMHWYFMRFLGSSPFGYSNCFDIKTAIAVKFDRPIARSGRRNWPTWLDPDAKHTHNALDDAREQGQLFSNLLEWRGMSQNAVF